MIWKNFIYGLIIGLGFIIPGVSGGVLATMLGIYEKIIDKLLNFSKDFKNNCYYFLPLGLGILLSILFFSKIILYLLENKLEFISYVFIGLILGCVPYLFLEIKHKPKQNFSFKMFSLTFLLGLILFFIERKFPHNLNNPHFLTMVIAGFLYAVGKIIPGISGASLLMFIGVYEYFLNIIAHPLTINFLLIIKFIPFIISFIFSAIIILKLMNFLLKNHFGYTYSAIIGFVVSSTLFIIPNTFNYTSLITIILSFLISYEISLNRTEQK